MKEPCLVPSTVDVWNILVSLLSLVCDVDLAFTCYACVVDGREVGMCWMKLFCWCSFGWNIGFMVKKDFDLFKLYGRPEVYLIRFDYRKR